MMSNKDRVRLFLIVLIACLLWFGFYITPMSCAQFLPLQAMFSPMMGGFFGFPAMSYGIPYTGLGLGLGLTPFSMYGYSPQMTALYGASTYAFNNPFALSTYTLTGSMAPFQIGSMNAYASLYGTSYGAAALLQGTYPRQTMSGSTLQGYNPYLSLNQWGQNLQYNSLNSWLPWGYGTLNNYTNTDDDDNDDDDDDIVTDEIPDIRGYWSGTWTILETETDPNGLIVLVEKGEGDILFHITSQIQTGGSLSGTVEITGWNVEDFPDWYGESDETKLTGWVDKSSKYLHATYFNFTGDKVLADLSNVICSYGWHFDSLRIKDSGFSGNFAIQGTNNYYVSGTFSVASYQP